MLSSRVRTVFDLLLDICLPPTCARCGRGLGRGATRFCDPCLCLIRTIAPPICLTCGTPFISALRDHVCGRCVRRKPAFRAVRAAGYYEGALLEALRRLKFGGDVVQVPALAALLVPALASLHAFTSGTEPVRRESVFPSSVHLEIDRRPAYDLVVPVPLHPRRLRERGFNQAHLIAAEIVRRGSFARLTTLEPRCLERVRETPPQTRLQRSARLTNLRDAFRARPGVLRGRSILLVDDVITTGATIEECVRVMRRAGARSVDALVVAKVV